MPTHVNSRPRAGFTLVEMLAVALLSAMLIIAVWDIASTLASTQRGFERESERKEWCSGALDVIRDDLMSARQLRNMQGTVELETLMLIESTSGHRRHWPTTVCYRIVEIDRRRFLVREQRAMVADPNPSHCTELLLADVAAFGIEPSNPVSTRATAGAIGAHARPALPRKVQVRIVPARPDCEPLYQEVILQ